MEVKTEVNAEGVLVIVCPLEVVVIIAVLERVVLIRGISLSSCAPISSRTHLVSLVEDVVSVEPDDPEDVLLPFEVVEDVEVGGGVELVDEVSVGDVEVLCVVEVVEVVLVVGGVDVVEEVEVVEEVVVVVLESVVMTFVDVCDWLDTEDEDEESEDEDDMVVEVGVAVSEDDEASLEDEELVCVLRVVQLKSPSISKHGWCLLGRCICRSSRRRGASSGCNC